MIVGWLVDSADIELIGFRQVKRGAGWDQERQAVRRHPQKQNKHVLSC